MSKKTKIPLYIFNFVMFNISIISDSENKTDLNNISLISLNYLNNLISLRSNINLNNSNILKLANNIINSFVSKKRINESLITKETENRNKITFFDIFFEQFLWFNKNKTEGIIKEEVFNKKVKDFLILFIYLFFNLNIIKERIKKETFSITFLYLNEKKRSRKLLIIEKNDKIVRIKKTIIIFNNKGIEIRNIYINIIYIKKANKV